MEPLEPRTFLSVTVAAPERVEPADLFPRQANSDTEFTVADNGLALFYTPTSQILAPGITNFSNIGLYNPATQAFSNIDLGQQVIASGGDISGDGSVVAIEYVDDLGQRSILLYDVATDTIAVSDLRTLFANLDLAEAISPALSQDGRYLAFVGNDGLGPSVVLRYDLLVDELIAVSLTDQGEFPDDDSSDPQISSDGRYIVFESEASNLLTGDTPPGVTNIYLYDNSSGTVERVNPDLIEGVSSNLNLVPMVSDDGRFIAYEASTFINSNTFSAIVLVDRQQGASFVSVNGQGGITGNSLNPTLSDNGRYVTFVSDAEDLVSGDTNLQPDAFVYDRVNQTTRRVSLGNSGQQGNRAALSAVVNGNGTTVTFYSEATNLLSTSPGLRVPLAIFNVATAQVTPVPLPALDEGDDFSFLSGTDPVSGNGFIVLESMATNLVGDDFNGLLDVFRYNTATGAIDLVSFAQAGPADGNSSAPSISRDGRYVVFESDATNIIPGDANFSSDIFRYDAQTQQVVPVSLNFSLDEQADNDSFDAAISNDGRYVVYSSDASNLVAGDANNLTDIYLADLVSQTVTRISLNPFDEDPDGASSTPDISGDGRFVVFASEATNLLSSDQTITSDIYLWDRNTGNLALISRTSGNAAGNGQSINPQISNDGRWVVFESSANDLVANDSNGVTDVFVLDRQNNTMRRVSLPDGGTGQANGPSYDATISDDGRFVSFTSEATNLTTDGTAGSYIVDLSDNSVTFVGIVDGYLSPSGNLLAMTAFLPLVTGDTNQRPDVYFADLSTQASQPQVSLLLSASSVSEGSSATLTVQMDRPTEATVTATVSFSGTAGSSDFTASRTSVTIPSGQTSATITLNALRDTEPETTESLIIDLASVTNAQESGTQQRTLTIIDVPVTPPDVTGVFGTLPTVTPNQTFNFNFTLQNIGGGDAVAATGTRIDFYFSRDTVLDSQDTLLTSDVPRRGETLEAGDSELLSLRGVVPPFNTGGTYYLIADIDPNETIDEVSTSNNVIVAPITLQLAFGQIDGGKTIKLTFNDPDGTVTTFGLTGGGVAEIIRVEGGLFDIFINDTTIRSALNITTRKGTGDGLFQVRNIVVGGSAPQAVGRLAASAVAPADEASPPLSKFVAKTTRLLGTLDAPAGLSSVQIAEADGAVINIGPTGNAKDAVTLNLVTAKNLTINSQLPIKSLTTSQWIDDAGAEDAISAPTIGSIKVKGDFQANVTTTTAPATGTSLGAVSVGGTISGAQWNIAGSAKSLKAANLTTFNMAAQGDAGSITAVNWNSGSLTAQSLKSLALKGNLAAAINLTGTLAKMSVGGNASGNLTAGLLSNLAVKGNWSDAAVRLNAANLSAGKIQVKGSVTNVNLRAASNVTQFTAGSLTNSLLFLGVNNPNAAALPQTAGEFTTARLGKLTLTGATGSQLVNSDVAASAMGAVVLKVVQIDNADTFGLAAATIDSFNATLNGQTVKLSKLTAGGSRQDGQFVLRLVQ